MHNTKSHKAKSNNEKLSSAKPLKDSLPPVDVTNVLKKTSTLKYITHVGMIYTLNVTRMLKSVSHAKIVSKLCYGDKLISKIKFRKSSSTTHLIQIKISPKAKSSDSQDKRNSSNLMRLYKTVLVLHFDFYITSVFMYTYIYKK